MTEKKWALRRSPTVHFEGPFIGPDKWNRIAAVHDGNMIVWDDLGHVMGGYREDFDLVPLQVPPKKTLRCWASDRGSYVALNQYDPITHNSLSPGWVEMIERAPGDKLAEAVHRWKADEIPGSDLIAALREYDEATK